MSLVVGVLGGMGPAATLDFLVRLHAATPATGDADHLRVITDSNPQVPGRNAALSGEGPSPGPALAAMARGLVAAGAQLLAMPCNAAHNWAPEVRAVAGADFVDIVDAAIAEAMVHTPRTIGILAIGATLDARLYNRAPVPVIAADRDRLQPLIDRIKAGDTGSQVAQAMATIAADLVAAGADVIIAACTEVPLVLPATAVPMPLIDTTAALARATLAAARLSVR